MKVTQIPIVKEDDRGIIYRCEPVNYIARKQGTVSGDHTHDYEEIIYLVQGAAEVTLGEETQSIEAPVVFTAVAGEYHKVVAKTDIVMVRFAAED